MESNNNSEQEWEKKLHEIGRRDLVKMLLAGSAGAGAAAFLSTLSKTESGSRRTTAIQNALSKSGVDTSAGDPVFSSNYIQFPSLASDPTLAAGTMWLRSDLLTIHFSPDGTNVYGLGPRAPVKYVIAKIGSNYISFDLQGGQHYSNTEPGAAITSAFDATGASVMLDGQGAGPWTCTTSATTLYNQTHLTAVNGGGLTSSTSSSFADVQVGSSSTNVDTFEIDRLWLDGQLSSKTLINITQGSKGRVHDNHLQNSSTGISTGDPNVKPVVDVEVDHNHLIDVKEGIGPPNNTNTNGWGPGLDIHDNTVRIGPNSNLTYGIFFQNNTVRSTIHNNTVFGATQSGITSYATSDCNLSGNTLDSCTNGMVLYQYGSTNSCVGNNIYNSGSNGMLLGASVAGGGNGIGPSVIALNTFRNNGVGTNNTYSDIVVYGNSSSTPTVVSIIGNIFQYSGSGNKVKYCIYEETSTDTTTLVLLNNFMGANPGTALVSLQSPTSYTDLNQGLEDKSIPHTPSGGTGAVTIYMDKRSISFKHLTLYFAAYGNNSSGSDTLTFPVPFTNTPVINGTNISPSTTLSATSATLTIPGISNTSPVTGYAEIWGN